MFNLITKSLEKTEPVELEEVPDEQAPTLPDEFQSHVDEPGFDYESDPLSTLDLEGEGE